MELRLNRFKHFIKILHLALPLICLAFVARGQDYNVLDYGAIGDGQFLNTEAIQKTIDVAHAAGGGRVILPEGKYLSGSLDLKSGVDFHLTAKAILLGSIKHEDHRRPEGTYMRGILLASHQNNIKVTGTGTIDGQGLEAALHVDSLYHAGVEGIRYNFEEKRPRFYMRPMLIVFVSCTNVQIRNVKLINSASWVQHYDRCRNLVIDSMHVESDAYWNNDGIDISDCNNVRLTNSYFNSADDGICLKSHFEDHIMDSVYIANCTVRSSASAVKFGTKSLGGFRNVHIEKIRVFDTFRSAIAIESVDGGILEDILVDGIKATNTGNAIFIRLGNREPDKGTSVLKNVTLKNIEVDIAFERPDYAYEMRGPNLAFFHNIFPSSITGIIDHKVENVSLENIIINFPGRGNKAMAYVPISKLDSIPECVSTYPEFSMFGELPAWGFYIRHVSGLSLENITLNLQAPDYRAALIMDDVQDVKVVNLKISGSSEKEQIIIKEGQNVEVDREELVRKL